MDQQLVSGYRNGNFGNKALVRQRNPQRIRAVSLQQPSFEVLLQKAHKMTYEHPEGQLQGRAGRRSILEDGERILIQCLQIQPQSWKARYMLLVNLEFQNRGRENEIPDLFLDGLTHTKFQDTIVGNEDLEDFWKSLQLSQRIMNLEGFSKEKRHIVNQKFLDSIFDREIQ
eukprot:TRINITY_DN7296_c0_g1_i1.p2 TRINITY_DN7296_c0_g1~~TRINITY_DN7296_c0_g1_i1.p2  ORF type:complete len:171 (-),score=9.51 TRINITY_DN7296_c0_g1_i1:195-707(-)